MVLPHCHYRPTKVGIWQKEGHIYQLISCSTYLRAWHVVLNNDSSAVSTICWLYIAKHLGLMFGVNLIVSSETERKYEENGYMSSFSQLQCLFNNLLRRKSKNRGSQFDKPWLFLVAIDIVHVIIAVIIDCNWIIYTYTCFMYFVGKKLLLLEGKNGPSDFPPQR